MDVALATCSELPEPDFDAAPLIAALRQAGISCDLLAWDDPAADWSAARLTVLRSTWDYPLNPGAFIAWAESVAGVSTLWNPLAVVRWNLHKSYLLELERQGVPVTPTELVPRGSAAPLAAVIEKRGWQDVVIKPAQSAASYRTLRAGAAELERGEAHLRRLAADGDVLVQRYLPSVEDYGERALVWIDGELTHAVRKSRRFEGETEEVSAAVEISAAERELADRALAVVEGPLLYARIDVAPGPDGAPVVMELELIEPSLFFPQSRRALDRFVAAIAARLDSAEARPRPQRQQL